jgi:hypothetical protein
MIRRAFTVAFSILSLCMSLAAFQVAMNVWNSATFADGMVITTLAGSWKAAPASLAFDPVAGPPVVPVFNERKSSLTISSGNTSTFDGGTYGHGTACTGSGFGGGPDATNAIWTHHNTSSTSGTTAGCSGNLMLVVGRGVNFQHGHSFFDNGGAIISQTNSRVFLGVTDQTAATMTSSNDPAGNYLGFRVDSGTDSNYRCVAKNGTTQQTADSGVAVTGSTGHTFEITEDVAAGVWYLRIDDAPVCSFNSNLPASGTVLRYVTAIQNKAAEQKALNFWWVYTTMEK